MPDAIDIRRLAELSKLSLTDEEVSRLAPEMSRVIAFAQQLSQIDLDAVPPMANVPDAAQAMRDDHVQPSLPVQTVLDAAPSTRNGCIAVPRTVE